MQIRRQGRTKASMLFFSFFISFISANMWARQNGSKSWRGAADDPAVPEATKEATLSAECGTVTTIVSLQYR